MPIVGWRSDAELAQINQAFKADPRIQALIAKGLSPQQIQAVIFPKDGQFDPAFADLKIPAGAGVLDSNYNFTRSPDAGGLTDPKVGIPLALSLGVAPMVYGAFAGGGGAAAGGEAAFDSSGAFLGPTTVTGEVAAPAVAGGTTAGSLSSLGGAEAGTDAGTSAATAGGSSAFDAAGNFTGATTVAGETGGSMSLWGTLAKYTPEIIGAGTQLAGSKIAADANTDAARIQADSAAKALQWQKDLFGQYRSDLNPYRGAGYAALSRLTGQSPTMLSHGAETVSPLAPNLAGSQAQAPQAATPTPGAVFGPGGQNAITALNRGGPLVTVKAPTGETRQIPQSQLQKALQLGAQQVN